MSGPRRQRQSPERRARSDDARRNRLSELTAGPRFRPPCLQPGLKSAHFQRMRKNHRRPRKNQPCANLCYHVARAPGDAEAVSNAVDLLDPDPLAVLARPRAVAKTRRAGLYRAKFVSPKPAGTTAASRALYLSLEEQAPKDGGRVSPTWCAPPPLIWTSLLSSFFTPRDTAVGVCMVLDSPIV